MRTLLLTDLHLSNKSIRGVSLLEHQVECILSIIEEEKPHEIIIMGDIFMERKPSPSAILALKKILKFSRTWTSNVIMLRGNHDSETKADDGVTALSVFDTYDVFRARGVKTVTHTFICDKTKRVFIPHYENQETILEALAEAPEGYTVFGHFGFVGCLNSAGDKDFDIAVSSFNNRTYLGHIHKSTVAWNGDHCVTVLGTPYTTNFGEQGKVCYYGVLEEGQESFILKEINSGPHHMTIRYKDLMHDFDSFKSLIAESKHSILLRINLEKDDEVNHELLDLLDVIYMDFKFLPIEESKEQEQSEYKPDKDLFSINGQIIEDYIDKHNTSLDKDDIMWGLDLLKDEDK